jgi:hypothetical protein
MSTSPQESPSTRSTADDPASETKVHRLFDLRWVIAGLLSLYGVVLIVRGILDGSAELQKAAGVRINLWTGIGLLIVGLLFAAWAALRPLQPPTEAHQDLAMQTGQIPDSDPKTEPRS